MDTATVGRCLAHGQLVCRALAETFQTPTPKLRASKTLLVLLYPTKEEYVEQSARAGDVLERAFLKTTAGHYSMEEQVSRVVWNKSRDAERRIARIVVHELTHHWINDLNPRYANTELRFASSGYWIVEGFASFFEEGLFDVERGTWSLFDARSPSLDTVRALAKADGLLSWDVVLTIGSGPFRELSREKGRPIVRRWHLGREMFSPAGIFYAQSAATTHFLYHGEGGAYRERLIEYVTSYYTGKKDKLPIEAAFGLKPAELGKKVLDYANRVADGWRP
jgi:hypothetical protein